MYDRCPLADAWDIGIYRPVRMGGQPGAESRMGGLSGMDTDVQASGRSFTRPDVRVLAKRSMTMKDGTTGVHYRIAVPDGDDGVFATLWLMEYAVLRDSRGPELARIVARYAEGSKRATARALFRYVARNYPYRSDPKDREFVHGPVRTLLRNSPFAYRDCDDLAVALSGLLTAAGIRNAFTVIAWRPDAPQQFTHVYNEAYIDGRWIPMDLVMGANGWNNKRSPVNRRARWIVGEHVSMRRGETAALNDEMNDDMNNGMCDDMNGGLWDKGEVDIDFEAMAKDVLTRALPPPLGRGENAGEVLKQHFLAICMSGLKAQLYEHRAAAFGIAAGGAIIFTTIGFAMGTVRARRTMKRTGTNTRRGER